MDKNDKSAAQNDDQNLDYLSEFSGQGFEGLGLESYAAPFITILQAQSPQCMEGGEAYVPGAKAGQFFNTLTKKLYGMELDIIPLKSEPVYLEWAPNRGGFRGRHAVCPADATGDEFSEEGLTRPNGNKLQFALVFYCLIAGHPEGGPVVFSLTSSGIKHGKNWNSQILMSRLPDGSRAPYFGYVWRLKTVLNQNNDGSWYQIGSSKGGTNVKAVRLVTRDELLSFIVPQRKMLDSGNRSADFAQLEAPKTERAVSHADY